MTTRMPPFGRGDWIQTYSGRRFYPLDPRTDEVEVIDVAHALSNLCRFAGHTTRFYSVAEHSYYVSLFVPPAFALAALLHDAPEAYLVDLPRPIKHAPGMEDYRLAEFAVARCVEERFGLPCRALDAAVVKQVDNDLLLTERRDLMRPMPEVDAREWSMGLTGSEPITGLDLTLPVGPELARDLFMRRYFEVTIGGER